MDHIILNTDPDDHPLDDGMRTTAESAGGVVVELRPRTQESFEARAPLAVALLNSDFPLPAERIALLQRCRVISRFGAGLDNIDVGAASARGIVVTNTPDCCTEEVANHAWLLLLACACDLLRRDRSVRRGEWRQDDGLDLTRPVTGRVLGIVGLGKIGLAVARRAQAFGMTVIAHDPAVTSAEMARYGIERVALDDLLARADYVSLHCPLTDTTRHLIDARRIGLMKRTASLINTARGAIVDQAALVDALRKGRIAAAGLDVFDPEPPGKDEALYGLDNVILTPHLAANTTDSINRLRRRTVEQVVRVLCREPAASVVAG